jgi:uncharacterized protein (TIGR02118 family)
MTILTVTYPYSAANRFDEDYYRNTHLPLTREIWGDLVSDVHVHKGVPGLDGGDPAFFVQAHIVFKSKDALAKAFTVPRIGELASDTANYTDVTSALAIAEPWK